MNRIGAAANTIVPVILELEKAGFVISATEDGEILSATRGEDVYVAQEPEAILGLVKLVELRGWNWKATDAEIDDARARHPWIG